MHLMTLKTKPELSHQFSSTHTVRFQKMTRCQRVEKRSQLSVRVCLHREERRLTGHVNHLPVCGNKRQNKVGLWSHFWKVTPPFLHSILTFIAKNTAKPAQFNFIWRHFNTRYHVVYKYVSTSSLIVYSKKNMEETLRMKNKKYTNFSFWYFKN